DVHCRERRGGVDRLRRRTAGQASLPDDRAPRGDPAEDVMEQPWPVTFSVEVVWAEMDAFGHVNNTVYLRWFESARIHYFEKLGLATDAGHQAPAWPILAHTSIDYRSPVVYPDAIDIAARVTKLGTTSFTMAYRAHS